MRFTYILFLICLLGCGTNQSDSVAGICVDKNFSHPVSSVSLKDVNQIKQSNGEFVRVEGIIRYSFEDVALYPSSHSDANFVLWVDLQIPDNIPEIQLEKMDGKHVTIIGKVNMSKKGHLNAYFGTLDSAFCIKRQ